jgi:hypothetical protein
MSPLDSADTFPATAERFSYPASAMVGDYLRAAAGLIPTLLILVMVPLGTIAALVLSGFAAIFGVFAVRTALRHFTTLEDSDDALRAVGLRQATLAWDQLDRVKLAYYSTRRDRKNGWMQLELGAGRLRLSLDSRLDGFERLVRHAARAAGERDIELSAATATNLQALGIRVPEARVAR